MDLLAEMAFKVYRKLSEDVTPVDIIEALNSIILSDNSIFGMPAL
jgi:hypothetical protein